MGSKKKSKTPKKKATKKGLKKTLKLPVNVIKQFYISHKFLTILAILSPIAAMIGGYAWFYHTYAMTPLELYNIVRHGLPSLAGLDVLPGYLDMGDLPGYMEARKDTIVIIRESMEEHDFQMYDLVTLAKCESTFNPQAYNRSSGATGLFQYKDMTWGTTPYCDEDIWDTESQTEATIWMFEHNRYTEWECFRSYRQKTQPKYSRDYHACGKEKL